MSAFSIVTSKPVPAGLTGITDVQITSSAQGPTPPGQSELMLDDEDIESALFEQADSYSGVGSLKLFYGFALAYPLTDLCIFEDGQAWDPTSGLAQSFDLPGSVRLCGFEKVEFGMLKNSHRTFRVKASRSQGLKPIVSLAIASGALKELGLVREAGWEVIPFNFALKTKRFVCVAFRRACQEREAV